MSFESVKRARLASATIESTQWPAIPPEMKAMVIERMDVKTLCQFSACSKLSRGEAKRTGRLMSGIEIGRDIVTPYLEIEHGSYNPYRLEFIVVPESPIDQTMIFYKTRFTTVLQEFEKDVYITRWVDIVNGTPDEVRAKFVILHCQKYEDTIRKIVFNEISPYGIDLRSLKKLETIDLGCNDQFYEGIEMNQLLNAKTLKSINRFFTFDQFTQFNGYDIIIKMDRFNEEMMLNYLNLLNTSDIHKNLKSCWIHTADSNHRRPSAEFLNDLSKSFNIKLEVDKEDDLLVRILFDFAKIRIWFLKSYVLISRK